MAKVLKATKNLGAKVPIIGDSFENRRDQFLKEVNEIGTKYKIGLTPQLKYTREAIIPEFLAFDVKEASEQPKTKDTPNKQPTG
jgi:hypothetical protein